VKYKNTLFVFVTILSVISCSRNSDPTSPDNQKLTLNKGTDSAVVSLKYKQRAVVNEELTVKFEGVTADSRCPIDLRCVWAGDGEVKLILSNREATKEIILHTTLEPKLYDFAGYQIELKTLTPYPKSTETIKPEDYIADLTIKHSTSAQTESIKLINGNNSYAVKSDMININSVSLEKDILKFEMSYAGGCKTHVIDLYAYKEIEKSNPAQVTVMISHNANKDNCEALITKEVKFDLLPLKNFLKEHFNIQDKVMLLIFDPSGKPLRNSAIEFAF